MRKYGFIKNIFMVCIVTIMISGCISYNAYEENLKPEIEHIDLTTNTTENTTIQEPTSEESTTNPPVHIPTEEELAREILNSMTLEEKVGQMFIARCPVENADTLAAKYHLGGYILFARDFQGKTVDNKVLECAWLQFAQVLLHSG